MANRTSDPAASARDYAVCSPLEHDRAEVRFSGSFDGRTVEWHAKIFTLERVWRERGRGAAVLRPFLHVQAVKAECGRIEIGLGVERIDAPTIMKAVIMVRRYKALRRGLHEFGEPMEFTRR